MKKLLNFFDNYLLKIAVSFLIIFVAWYPKLPSINIHHTWVYIRLEDFSIAITVGIWLLLLLRRKVKIPFIIGSPIVLYWIFGFFSLILSLIFVAPTLANFFPSVAVLSYVRRIEYMVLFFVAYSTIRSKKDVKDYFVILCVTVFGFSLYALGQRYYLDLWTAFPAFFNKYQFCFPSFQTGNEEFAKGIPLCLPKDGRITSTFAGSYDLAAYLVLIIPILSLITITVKKNLYKILLGSLSLLAMIVEILTASRISFIAYIVATIVAFLCVKQKKAVLPFLVLSFVLLMIFSSSTAQRFLQTFRLTSVVTNSQGQIVGEELSQSLKDKLAKDQGVLANVPTQALPEGSGFIGLPQTKQQKTNVAVIQSNLSSEEAKKLELENGGVEISTISGTFLVQQAFVYDISFTTRFQAEWPNALKAFEKDPIFGSGYSTITLATDNDFLRFLGESGILGLASFLLIFIMFKITFKAVSKSIDDPLVFAFIYGFAAGIVGLFVNATLIDVFESSKVAESLWILSGIAIGTALLYKKEEIDYKTELKKILTSRFFTWAYITFGFILFFIPSIGNFFVADDFTWLKWAATSTLHGLGNNFVNAQGFFYRPIDKIVTFFLYTFFAFKPEGFHIFILALHLLVGFGVYFLALRIFKKFIPATVAALIFLFLPAQAENLYWFSTVSTTLCTLFIVYGLLAFLRFRGGKVFSYIGAIAAFALGLLSYEMGVIFFPLILVIDFVWLKNKPSKKLFASYVPFVLLEVAYAYIRTHANVVSVSGNYSYSLSHLIPNLVGNFVGYFGVFTIGENFFPIYDASRSALRSDSGIVIIFIAIAVIVLIAVIFATRDRVVKLIKSENVQIMIFGLVFSFVALLPFLLLGNIAERYGYLASIGFAIILTVIIFALRDLIIKFIGDTKRKTYAVTLIILVILFGFYFKGLNDSRIEWNNSGKITQRTLALFRIFYPDLQSHSNVYIVNLPIKEGQSWIFPTGINDGLWFIYRDDTINIQNFSTLDQAKQAKSSLSRAKQKNTYIFYFDKNKEIQSAQ